MVQQAELVGYPVWPRAHRKICRKNEVDCQLDEIGNAETVKAA